MAFPDDWDRRCAITIQSSKVDGDVTDYPVLINTDCLPSEIFDADGSYPALSDGGDIRFTSDEDGTTELPVEVAQWNRDNDPANGYGELYVKIPLADADSDVTIYIWYHNTGASMPAEDSAYGKENVWRSSHSMVHHFCAGPGSQADSTSNDIDGTAQGTNTFSDGDICDDSAWRWHAASYNAGTRDCGMNVGQTSPVDDLFDGGGTVLYYFNPDSVGGDSNPYGWMFDSANNGHDLFTRNESGGALQMHFRSKCDGGDGDWQTNSPTRPINIGSWNLLIVKYDDDSTANNPTMYINDTKFTEGSGLSSDNPGGSYRSDASIAKHCGCQWSGWADPDCYTDEVRWMTEDIGDGEAGTLYNNITDPGTFAVEGTPETPSAGIAQFIRTYRNRRT